MNYFESAERQELLGKVLNEWVGTPFRHKCGVKGLGCDCIHFVACVIEEIGFLPECKSLIPNYPKDWHIHNTRELLKEGVEKNLNVERVSLSALKKGDIILSHFGKASSHAGFYFGGYVYQALTKIGVRRIIFTDRAFKKRMKFGYRLLE